jgi:hypothetical protein
MPTLERIHQHHEGEGACSKQGEHAASVTENPLIAEETRQSEARRRA